MLCLKPSEIVSAFPEGAAISKRLASVEYDKIKHIEKVMSEVYNNATYDDLTKEFFILVLKEIYLKPSIKKYNQYKRSFDMYDSSCDDRRINLAKAKNVPIEDLHSFGKIKSSRNKIFCKCPFHDEKNSSFVIYTETNTFHCFGCMAGGDSIAFVMKMHNKSFVDAIHYLNKF